MPLFLPVPTELPDDDIGQYVPLLLSAVEGFLQLQDVWAEADYVDGFLFMEALKRWIVENIPMPPQAFPSQSLIIHQTAEVITGSAIVFAALASTQYGGIWRQSSSTQNNKFIHTTFLRKGTYDLRVVGQKNTTCGKMHVDIGASEVAVQDWYAAAAAMATIVSNGIVIETDGDVSFICQIKDKNAASAGYDMRLCTFYLSRTGQ